MVLPTVRAEEDDSSHTFRTEQLLERLDVDEIPAYEIAFFFVEGFFLPRS
jgi:hypothetical protein